MELAFLLITLGKTLGLLLAVAVAVCITLWWERMLLARFGAGAPPAGFLEPVKRAAAVMLHPSDPAPQGLRGAARRLAPWLALMTALIPLAVIPFGPEMEFDRVDLMQVIDLDIGAMVLVAALAGWSVVAAAGGWSAGTWQSLEGARRAAVQSSGFLLAVAVSLIGVILLTGSQSLRIIVESQSGTFWWLVPDWNIFPQVFGFLCFFAGSLAAAGAPPFDAASAEEIDGGWRAGFSGTRLGALLLSDTIRLLVICCAAVVLYLGGWHGPAFDPDWGPEWMEDLIPLLWFSLKVAAMVLPAVWIRATLPRFSPDQLVKLGWKILLPVAVANLALTGLVLALRYG